jgi:hypothetical protein
MKRSLLVLLCAAECCFAARPESFFYTGLIGGFAKIDWDPIIAQDTATYPTNPTEADGQGSLFGADVGYQINKYFAVEAEYIRMPNTYLQFKPVALPAYGVTSTESTLDFAAIIVKIMAPLGDSGFSLFTDAGPAYQYRSDDVATIDTFAPTFGAGVNYMINEHWMANVTFQYATGYGESIATPMDEYIPEIYAYTFSLNYIFG